ncbi:hypothetical protein A3Q56_08097 [Intoshia linei]|uniref:Cytochrome b561 domain-containing protein n=1 Tax=Intoshia linei TaxID=1819745 RepID=A0A177AQC8_9BILA|nr:hypothetical protein A3Q56_08097 [Intoshia linei]
MAPAYVKTGFPNTKIKSFLLWYAMHRGTTAFIMMFVLAGLIVALINGSGYGPTYDPTKYDFGIIYAHTAFGFATILVVSMNV